MVDFFYEIICKPEKVKRKWSLASDFKKKSNKCEIGVVVMFQVSVNSGTCTYT